MNILPEIIPDENFSDYQDTIVKTIKAFFLPDNESRYTVICYRFGLDQKPILTLDDIAPLVGVTSRERVRQLEKDAIIKFRNFLDTGISPKKQLQQDILLFMEEYRQTLNSFAPVSNDTVLLSHTSNFFNIDNFDINILNFLMAVYGFEYMRLSDKSIAYIFTPIKIKRIENLIKLISDHLKNKVEARTWQEILIEVNKKNKAKKYLADDVQLALKIAPDIESLDDQTFQIKFAALRSVQDRVYRLVYNRPEQIPFASDELVQIHNDEMRKHQLKTNSQYYIKNSLSSDKRFTPIGKGGYWTLTNWEYAPEQLMGVPDLINWVLSNHHKPLTMKEIYHEVSKIRSIDINTLRSIISQNLERFVYLLDDTIFLRTLTPTDQIALQQSKERSGLTSIKVAFLIEEIFKKENIDQIPLVDLHRKLSLLLPEHESQIIWGHLTKGNPAIIKLGSNKNIIAQFVAEYKKSIPAIDLASQGDRGPFIRKTIKDMLAKQGRMLLRDLRNTVSIKCNIKPHNVYAHVKAMDDVIKNKENKNIYCELQLNIPKRYSALLSRITNHKIHEDVARGLSNLDVENIDLGLFILGRAFDVVSKNYFIKLAQYNQISSKKSGLITIAQAQDANKFNLSARIDLLVSNHHIEYKEPLDFLRKERNDPAHNIYSQQRKEEMVATSSHVVEWYLEYIILFENNMLKLK